MITPFGILGTTHKMAATNFIKLVQQIVKVEMVWLPDKIYMQLIHHYLLNGNSF